MNFANVKSITIPEGVVTKIVAAGVTLWEAVSYKNLMPTSIDSSGAIYNGTGWKYGYRLSSSKGTETAASYHTITGFMPAKAGDVIRFSGSASELNWNASSGCSVV